MFNLTNKRALVCGASKGIGESIARTFADAGAEVILASRNIDALQRLKSSLNSDFNQSHKICQLDLGDIDSLEQKILPLVQEKPIHILINNTGGPPPSSVIDTKIAVLEEYFRSLVLAPHKLFHLLFEGMKRELYGRIINITSTSIKEPINNLAASNIIRAATANWAKSLSKEVAHYGITVNNILPGYIYTDRLKALLQSKSKKLNKSLEEVKKDIISKIPYGKIATPDAIAYTALFLASDKAYYINGINLPVDGGRLNSL